MVVYERLITPDAAGAALALDAGETMLDNGYLDQARALLDVAGDLADRNRRDWIERRRGSWWIEYHSCRNRRRVVECVS